LGPKGQDPLLNRGLIGVHQADEGLSISANLGLLNPAQPVARRKAESSGVNGQVEPLLSQLAQ
jgi:hypothetical protein